MKRLLIIITILLFSQAAFASTNVVVMPDRDALKGTPIVVWGNTKLPNGTSYTIEFGDGTDPATGTVSDQSYIAVVHTYNVSGAFPAKLTVGTESEFAKVTVWDSASLTPENLRAVKINMAIQDGLRALYFNQTNRAATFNTNMTAWTNYGNVDYTLSYTSLAVLALQNHGHSLTSDPKKDIFQPLVERGLNYLFNNLAIITLTSQVHGPPSIVDSGDNLQRTDDPCVNVANDDFKCFGLGRAPNSSWSMYSSSVTALGIAAATSQNPTRTVPTGIGPSSGTFTVAGRTFREVLQRQVNAIAWAQGDRGSARGGFDYRVNQNSNSDGSSMGWALLALLDAEAAGAQIPPFVRTELAFAAGPNIGLYTLDASQEATLNYTAGYRGGNYAKTGILLQALRFINAPSTDPRVTKALNYLSNRWSVRGSDDGFACGNGWHNLGCAYGMFNAFKGLKLFAVSQLAGVNRAAGPGAIVANDWFAAYEDWLVDNQTNKASTSGGFWYPGGSTPMYWSCCDNDQNGITAVGLLVLAPVALVRPSLLIIDITSTKSVVGGQASVTTTAKTEGGGLVSGATITFTVLQGPNAGTTKRIVTDQNGQATFTYSTANFGTDKVQANIDDVKSPIVDVIWKRLPVFSAIPRQGTRPGKSLTFVVTAVDPDGTDAVTVTAGAIPQGATFNAATRTFSWPNSGGQGPATVEFTAQYSNYISSTPPKLSVVIGKYPGSSATDPNNPDTDGDGWSDGAEIAAGTDPLDPSSHPSGTPPATAVAGSGAGNPAAEGSGNHRSRWLP